MDWIELALNEHMERSFGNGNDLSCSIKRWEIIE
jgi:hypothetical protein